MITTTVCDLYSTCCTCVHVFSGFYLLLPLLLLLLLLHHCAGQPLLWDTSQRSPGDLHCGGGYPDPGVQPSEQTAGGPCVRGRGQEGRAGPLGPQEPAHRASRWAVIRAWGVCVRYVLGEGTSVGVCINSVCTLIFWYRRIYCKTRGVVWLEGGGGAKSWG